MLEHSSNFNSQYSQIRSLYPTSSLSVCVLFRTYLFLGDVVTYQKIRNWIHAERNKTFLIQGGLTRFG